MDEEKHTDLSIPELMRIARISRSTAMRWLHAGKLAGAVKKHPCGAVCGDPRRCRQGAWKIPHAAVQAIVPAAAAS